MAAFFPVPVANTAPPETRTESSVWSGENPATPAPDRPIDHLPSTWLTTRSAGVLALVSSLPGNYGIGNLGCGARAFIDFLAGAGVRHWQFCPIGPTGYGDSPYQLFSGRAGNPYFIDLGELSKPPVCSWPPRWLRSGKTGSKREKRKREKRNGKNGVEREKRGHVLTLDRPSPSPR